LDRLIAAWRQLLASLAVLLERRRAEGHVRLCHGDLHLRNICLVEGRPTLFDCVEFNDEIARIDVLYDLAFLLMDLHYRHLTRLENQVFNRYLDLRDEAAGLAALPLFLSLRAAIRAHTGAAAAARQPEPERAALQRREATAYLDAACAFLASPAPRLVAVGGLSGTGKTSLAYAIAPELGRAPGARVLRSDVLRKRLMGVAPEVRLGSEAYTPAISARVYQLLCAEAAEALSCGQAVVADAVFLKEVERDAIAEVGRAAGIPFTGLWLEAPYEVMENRIRARCADASDATAAVLRHQRNMDKGRISWLRLDAKRNEPKQIARKAREALAATLARSE
jgi:predicted kinase